MARFARVLLAALAAAGGGLAEAAADAAFTRDLHVSPAGSDETGTGAAERPFASIGAALQRATPGTRVLVAEGVYGPIGSHAGLQGTAQAPIAVVGSGQVVVDGGGEAMGLHLSRPRHVSLEGFTVRNAWPHGISIDDGDVFDSPASHLVLRRLHFRDIGTGGNNDCLKLSGVADFEVLDSEFEGCDRGEAIDMVGAHRGTISRNYFHDMPGIAVQTKGGSADVLIHGNRFEDIGQRGVNAGGYTGRRYFRPQDAAHEAEDIRAVANVFLRTGDTALAFVGCERCLFAHNTIVEPHRYVARILHENPNRAAGTNGAFLNNLIVLRAGELKRHPVDAEPGARPETFTFASNLWYALDRRGYRGPRFGEGIPPETGSIVQRDPLLADRRAGDYRLRPGSPAIGAGQPLSESGGVDFDGRQYADPPSVGAFERAGQE